MENLNSERIIKDLEEQLRGYENISGIYLDSIMNIKLCGAFRSALALIKKLTEENEAWKKQLISTEEKSGKAYYELACEVEDLRAKVTDLQDELKCEKETNAHLCSQYMSEMHLRQQAEEMLANGMSVVKADTVRKMQERLKKEAYPFPCAIGVEYAIPYCKIDQIAKEMLEGENEASGGE